MKNKSVELDALLSQILSHTRTNALFFTILSSLWKNAAVRPRRDHLFHHLITLTLVRSLWYGIVVIGVVDAFVYAHHHHRRNLDHPGNFGDCMQRRFQLKTAITPTYAHAYQSLCLAGRPLVVPHEKFRLPAV